MNCRLDLFNSQGRHKKYYSDNLPLQAHPAPEFNFRIINKSSLPSIEYIKDRRYSINMPNSSDCDHQHLKIVKKSDGNRSKLFLDANSINLVRESKMKDVCLSTGKTFFLRTFDWGDLKKSEKIKSVKNSGMSTATQQKCSDSVYLSIPEIIKFKGSKKTERQEVQERDLKLIKKIKFSKILADLNLDRLLKAKRS